MIFEPHEPDPFRYDREHAILPSDWTDEDPERVFAKLKRQSDDYNFNKRTLGSFFRDVRQHGLGDTLANRAAWGEMRMTPMDLADVSGNTYTYLMNGTAPAGDWTGLVRPGERVRLRFINGSSMTYFDVRIPGMKMTVVAADGLKVNPVTVDEFRLAVAETFDVIVGPSGQDAFTIFAQSMDRTGYARGTLAVRDGLSAPVPEPDPRPLLTMADMGHDMSAMAAPTAGAKVDDPHAGHATPPQTPATPDPHTSHTMPAAQAPATPDPHAGHDMSGMTVQSHPASETAIRSWTCRRWCRRHASTIRASACAATAGACSSTRICGASSTTT